MKDYFAFLLRLWRSDGDSQAWYSTLEDPHTHQVRGFATWDAMLDFLNQICLGEISDISQGDPCSPGSDTGDQALPGPGEPL